MLQPCRRILMLSSSCSPIDDLHSFTVSVFTAALAIIILLSQPVPRCRPSIHFSCSPSSPLIAALVFAAVFIAVTAVVENIKAKTVAVAPPAWPHMFRHPSPPLPLSLLVQSSPTTTMYKNASKVQRRILPRSLPVCLRLTFASVIHTIHHRCHLLDLRLCIALSPIDHSVPNQIILRYYRHTHHSSVQRQGCLVAPQPLLGHQTLTTTSPHPHATTNTTHRTDIDVLHLICSPTLPSYLSPRRSASSHP